jgi:UDP-N-acetylmuramoyl-L-alanyl-D-glutamate--2,6-diaminopimelate ligase
VELAALCNDAGVASRVVGATAGVDVVDIAYRSERAGPGSLFCALRGARADGHDHAPSAVANGAVAVLVERELPGLGVPQIVCEDARAGMALLADALYGHPSRELEVVGVTGTNGKTTTTLLLAAILDAAQRPCGLLGTVERRIGGRREAAGLTTPEAPDLQRSLRSMLEAGDEACAMEASSIAISQRRLVGTRFAAVGFTNFSQDHLDFHGDLESYFAAKATLFDGRFPRAVNADDPWGARLEAELRFGVEAAADVHCEAFELRPDRTELYVRTPAGALSLEPRLRGRFNVDNVLCAVTLALLLEVPLGAIEHAVAATGAPPGRFEPVEAGQGFGVIVDYAHTPAGIAAVLASARPLAHGRLLCVFGAGGDRDQAKRPLMGAAAEAGAERLYVTSDNPRSESNELIATQILAGLERPSAVLVEHDRRRAISLALADAEPGDLVLILGKGHEQGQDIGGVVEPFDDRGVAQELLGGSG